LTLSLYLIFAAEDPTQNILKQTSTAEIDPNHPENNSWKRKVMNFWSRRFILSSNQNLSSLLDAYLDCPECNRIPSQMSQSSSRFTFFFFARNFFGLGIPCANSIGFDFSGGNSRRNRGTCMHVIHLISFLPNYHHRHEVRHRLVAS
jgi:hypothetical protein